ncbi:MAG: PEP-CTERM sorting domain-containing protein [Bryobacteraceae bacterium]
MSLHRVVLACALAIAPVSAATVYDFDTTPIGTRTPITFPDGTVIESSSDGGGFYVGGLTPLPVLMLGNVLRDDRGLVNYSFRIRFSQPYDAISLDFAQLDPGPWVEMILVNGGAATGLIHAQGIVLTAGGWPEGTLSMQGALFDTIYMTACRNLDSNATCHFPGDNDPVAPFAVDNIKVWVTPEPATGALLLSGIAAIYAWKRRSTRMA